jgi:hypothetical protein
MKRLIENSIIIRGIGYPRTKTIFTIQREEEKNNIRYNPLTQFIGRNLTVQFKYIEYLKDIKELEAPLTSGETVTVDSEFVDIIDKEKSGIEKSGRTKITIPKSQKEEDIQKFIINQIETFLGIIEAA